jgi:anti-anti-sigma regulatory factor
MLRIRRDDLNSHETHLLLQGRIVAAWAEMLERECGELSRSGFHVVLDLSDVIFVARTGLEALGRLACAGVGITGASPLIAAMLEQEGIPANRTMHETSEP